MDLQLTELIILGMMILSAISGCSIITYSIYKAGKTLTNKATSRRDTNG